MRAPHCSVLSSAKYVCSQVCVSPCPSAPPRTRSYEDGQKPAAAGSVQNASLPFGAGTHEPESSAFQADSTVVHLIAFPHVRVCVCVYARTHAHTRACVHACMRACTHCAQRAWPACDATVIFVLWWACSSRCPARTKKGDAHHPHGTHCTFLPESSFGSCVHSWHTRRRGPSRKARARPRSTRRAACAPGTHARTCSWKHSRQSPASRHRGRPWPPTRASCSPSTTRMHARHLRAAPPPTIASPEIFVLCSWDETTNQLPVPWYVDVPRGFQPHLLSGFAAKRDRTACSRRSGSRWPPCSSGRRSASRHRIKSTRRTRWRGSSTPPWRRGPCRRRAAKLTSTRQTARPTTAAHGEGRCGAPRRATSCAPACARAGLRHGARWRWPGASAPPRAAEAKAPEQREAAPRDNARRMRRCGPKLPPTVPVPVAVGFCMQLLPVKTSLVCDKVCRSRACPRVPKRPCAHLRVRDMHVPGMPCAHAHARVSREGVSRIAQHAAATTASLHEGRSPVTQRCVRSLAPGAEHVQSQHGQHDLPGAAQLLLDSLQQHHGLRHVHV